MAQDWTTSDLALVLALPAGPRPGERLQAALRDAIRQDVLGDGDALPATRELAAELGVADPAYFSRFFTRRTGLSPQQSRQAHRAQG